MIIMRNTRLTDEQIATLVRAGFRRWTKYDRDRLYASAEAVDLQLDYYNTGNIRTAKLNGERISNSQGRRILGTIDGAYIDVDTGTIHGTISACDLITNAIAKL